MSYPLLDFCLLSDPVKQDPILDQFSMITRPYPRVNGLKTISFPVAHTCIANMWKYPSKSLMPINNLLLRKINKIQAKN